MSEVCFCGWSGEMTDKVLLLLDREGGGVLCCPRCGHVDSLGWLVPTQREALLKAAYERQIRRELGVGVAA